MTSHEITLETIGTYIRIQHAYSAISEDSQKYDKRAMYYCAYCTYIGICSTYRYKKEANSDSTILFKVTRRELKREQLDFVVLLYLQVE